MTIDEQIVAKSERFMASSSDPRITGKTPTEQEVTSALKLLAEVFGLMAKKGKQ